MRNARLDWATRKALKSVSGDRVDSRTLHRRMCQMYGRDCPGYKRFMLYIRRHQEGLCIAVGEAIRQPVRQPPDTTISLVVKL